MKITLNLLFFAMMASFVQAEDRAILPTQTSFVKSGESTNLSVFENNLRPPYLIKDGQNQRTTIFAEMRKYHIHGVSIAAIHNGKIAWVKSYGYKNYAAQLPLTTQDLFQAASISKPIAILGILKLVKAQKLDLDANINDYLVGWKVPETPYTIESYVTARMLMSHTAGINVHGFPGIPSNLSTPFPSIIDVLNGKKPLITTESVTVIQKPGASFYYSGGGISILQLAAQCISHQQNFALWMQNQVLIPLKMNNSTYQQPLPQTKNSIASFAYDTQGNPYSGKFHNYPELAAAGLWTNPTDLSQILNALIKAYYQESTILNLNVNLTKELFKTQPNSSFGLGIILDTRNNILAFGHSGVNDGFQSDMKAFVNAKPNAQQNQLKDGIVIMTNSDNGSVINQMLLNSFDDTYKIGYNPPELITPIPLSGKNISKYKLNFSLNDMKHQIIIKNGQLYLDWGYNVPQQKLYQIQVNSFVTVFGDKLNYSWKDNHLSVTYQYFDSEEVKVNIEKWTSKNHNNQSF